MREHLLQAAEKRVRASGFADMSFRDLANDVGVKSASVHYHFPKKSDLGEALIDAYTLRFKAALDEIDTDNPVAAIGEYIALYDQALVLDQSICLCGILGAESIGLPPTMTQKTSEFFSMNHEWLAQLFAKHYPKLDKSFANFVVASLEGAMVVASTSKDRDLFTQVGRNLSHLIQASAK